MDFFDSKTIEKALPLNDWVEAMESALLAGNSGDFLMPKRMHLDRGKDTFLLMPCISDEYWSTKLVSFCPGNSETGHPSIYGTLVLSNSKTGEPLAVMDGSKITAMRTAAVTAAGIKFLAPQGASSLGIVGAGKQGVFQTLFACSVRKISEIIVYDQKRENLKLFSLEIHKSYPSIKITFAKDSREVALNSEVIITATNSQDPVFQDDKNLFTGKTFIGIGSYKPDCREFPEQLFRQVDQIFIDTIDGKKESGDLIDPVKNNWVTDNKIYPIGDLIAGKIGLTSNPTKLFKTVGSAIFDLFAAKLIYESGLKIKH
jgi:ornithine cyclodeaminase/alanine dehydrogenase-like protein (mu-crystallin family)